MSLLLAARNYRANWIATCSGICPEEPVSKRIGCINTVTVSFLFITSRNFLTQRSSCRNLSFKRIEAFRMKKHLHFPFSLHVVSRIPVLILADLESLINPEPGSSFSLGHRFRYLMYHNLLIHSPGGGYFLQTTLREHFSTCLPGHIWLGILFRSRNCHIVPQNVWTKLHSQPQKLRVPISPRHQHYDWISVVLITSEIRNLFTCLSLKVPVRVLCLLGCMPFLTDLKGTLRYRCRYRYIHKYIDT